MTITFEKRISDP